jgi:hypothetical protein
VVARESAWSARRGFPSFPGLMRRYALLCVVPLSILIAGFVGPHADTPFDPLRGVDFGAFYAGATMVREGNGRHVGQMAAQRVAQQQVQREAKTGWKWYNAFPYPPVVSLVLSPLAALPLRTAYWVWAIGGLVSAALATWLLARTFCPAAVWAVTLVLFAFEPVWDVAWWGQIDTYLLLPVAAAAVLLTRSRGGQRDFLAGLLLGALAIKPIFVPIPLLALLLSRRRAAVGLIVAGSALAVASIAIIGIGGIRDYLDLSRFYQRFTGSPAIVEWRMFNIRGMAVRIDLGLSQSLRFDLVVMISVLLGAVTVGAAALGLRREGGSDLAVAAIMIGMLVTAYHTHVQSLVFLLVPLAVLIGRAARAGARFGEAIWWIVPVVAIHSGAFLLKPDRPSPSPNHARLETYLTACCLALLLSLCGLLIVNAKSVSRQRYLSLV